MAQGICWRIIQLNEKIIVRCSPIINESQGLIQLK